MKLHLTRRRMMASAACAALFGSTHTAFAQASRLSEFQFAARLHALAGFDPLPADLVAGLMRGLDAAHPLFLADDAPLPPAERERVLTALYTGVLMPKDGHAHRIGFADALMWAAIERSNNVISYCGGVPGFWADAPTI
jgi:hypothetical protein